jgi:hypothetical protein
VSGEAAEQRHDEADRATGHECATPGQLDGPGPGLVFFPVKNPLRCS